MFRYSIPALSLNTTLTGRLLSTTALIGALGCVAFGAINHSAYAASHREAPFITHHPKLDGADYYMFRSYETGRSGYVTLAATYNPLQAPGGAPNYFFMEPNGLYEIHVDNNGDGKEDITFQFRFTNTSPDNKLTIGGKQVGIPTVNSWLRPLHLTGCENGTFTFHAPTKFIAEWVESHYKHRLVSVWRSLGYEVNAVWIEKRAEKLAFAQ